MEYRNWLGLHIHKVRTAGLRLALKAFVHNHVLAYEKCFLFYRPLTCTNHASNPEFQFHIATEVDLPALGKFSSIYPQSQFAEWIRMGELIFLAYHRGTPVAFQVVSKRSRTHLPFSHFPPNARQVWIVDIYTAPAYRRHHLAIQLRDFREKVLLSMGYTESLATVFESNIASLAYVMQGVNRLIVHFRFLRVGWLTSLKVTEHAEELLRQKLLCSGVVLPAQKEPAQAEVSGA